MATQDQKRFRVGAAAHELGLHLMTMRHWIKAARIQVVQVSREMHIPARRSSGWFGKAMNDFGVHRWYRTTVDGS